MQIKSYCRSTTRVDSRRWIRNNIWYNATSGRGVQKHNIFTKWKETLRSEGIKLMENIALVKRNSLIVMSNVIKDPHVYHGSFVPIFVWRRLDSIQPRRSTHPFKKSFWGSQSYILNYRDGHAHCLHRAGHASCIAHCVYLNRFFNEIEPY